MGIILQLYRTWKEYRNNYMTSENVVEVSYAEGVGSYHGGGLQK